MKGARTHGTHWILSPRAALDCHAGCLAKLSGSVEIQATSFPDDRLSTHSTKTSGDVTISSSTSANPPSALWYRAPNIWSRWASMKDATQWAKLSDWAARASSPETTTIGLPKTSLQALTVVKPIRTPVNDPGPEAAANKSTSRSVISANPSAESTAGNSQLEYSSETAWGTAWSIALSLRTAMLPLASQVSIARTTIYEQFYHRTKV